MDQNDSVRVQWVEAFEASGLSQEEFARQHGLPARTLRSWRRKVGASRQKPPADTVRAAIEQAITALAAVRDRLDAACHEAEQPSLVEARTDDQATSSGERPVTVGSSPTGVLHQALAGAVADTVHRNGLGPGPAKPPDLSAAPAAAGKVHHRGFFRDLLK